MSPSPTIKNLIVVEDSSFFSAVIRKKLEALDNIKVTCVETLADARAILLRDRKAFSLALLDLNLPDANGVEIVDTIHNYGVPSVVFTGSHDTAIAKQMFNRGVIDYVIKDNASSLEYLQSVVHRLLANQSLKALVVDDSAHDRRVTSDLCKRYQMHVFQAVDGVEAFKIIEAHPDIRLVLTGTQMPNMDGFELTQKIREIHSKTTMAIIATSTAKEKGLSAKFIKTGANDFIAKPFEAEEFFCRISQSLDYLEHVEKLDIAATRDFLTGLRNRRSFFDVADPILAGLKRRKKKAVVAMIDADHFKAVNDTYGHDTGDEVLQAIATTLKKNVRESDVLARMGGEEFAIFAVDMDASATEAYFNKLREAIASIEIEVHDGYVRPKVSIGVRIGSQGTTSDLLGLADESLYKAKEAGRNCVIIDSD